MNNTGKKVICKLTGEDGNAFAILGRVIGAMKRAKWNEEEIEEYRKQAKNGDYDHLLQVTLEYVDEPDDSDTEDEFDGIEDYEEENEIV
jgi:hypothetical protein